MTSKTVGLHLYDTHGSWEALQRTQPGDKVYFFDGKSTDISVDFNPGMGTVTHFPPPYEHLVHRLKEIAPDGLTYIKVPKRKECVPELWQLREAGLINEDTTITKGF